MIPPAPARFSITKGLPRSSAIRAVTVRATISTAPPAGNGNSMRIGLSGYCAKLWLCAASRRRPISAANILDTTQPLEIQPVRPLFDDLIRPQQQPGRDGYAQRLRGPQVQHQLKLGWPLDRQIAGLGPLQDLAAYDA